MVDKGLEVVAGEAMEDNGVVLETFVSVAELLRFDLDLVWVLLVGLSVDLFP
jgi:hypothetical protein